LVNELESGLSAEPSVDPKITTWDSGGAQVFDGAKMRHFKSPDAAEMRHRQSRRNDGYWVSASIYAVVLFHLPRPLARIAAFILRPRRG
jgi:hypothetical protein